MFCVAGFITCWFPINLFNVLEDLGYPLTCWKYYYFTFFCSHCFAMASTVYNPLLYGLSVGQVFLFSHIFAVTKSVESSLNTVLCSGSIKEKLEGSLQLHQLKDYHYQQILRIYWMKQVSDEKQISISLSTSSLQASHQLGP